MDKLRVVIGETYRRNVKSASFLVMLFTPFIMVGIMGLSSFIGGSTAATPDIAVVSEEAELREAVIQGAKSEIDINEKYKTEKEAKAAVDDEKIGGYLLLKDNGGKIVATYYSGEKGDRVNTTQLTSIINNIQLTIAAQQMNLSQTELTKLFEPAEFSIKSLTEEDKDSNRELIMSFGALIVVILIWFIVYSYASVIATEVASEKGTRIMEVLLSSTRATTQFYGKIIGILLACLTQIAVYAVAGVIAFSIFKDHAMIKSALEFISLKDILRSFFGYNMLYFVLGILGYSGLAALCGSLVSKAEDSVKAIQPVTYLIMIGFFLGMFGMSNPQGRILEIASFVPFISPFTMPFRIAAGTVSQAGIFASLGISVVATVLILMLAAKLYSTNVLVYNDNGFIKSFKQSLTILKHEKVKK